MAKSKAKAPAKIKNTKAKHKLKLRSRPKAAAAKARPRAALPKKVLAARARERERARRLKERQRAVREKARAKELAAKEKARARVQKEKENARLVRERERERLARQKEKERIVRERAKEKERLRKEKEAARARARREKEAAKERARKEKELARAQALEAKLKERELARLTRGRPGRPSKHRNGDAERALLARAELRPEDAEARRTRLNNLIKLGKERGYLTYAEVNDHLPDDMVDAEQIESIITTFNDMGIQVYDEAPDAEQLLISENAPAAVPEEDVEEEAEAALSTVDPEFGRTTDPVRMYMREMGSVELLTREGEIEIAKRIEEGLKHMIQAISACPTTIHEILELADRVEREDMRVDEVVDGLIDPNAK